MLVCIIFTLAAVDEMFSKVPCAPVLQSLSTTFDNVEMKRTASVAGSIIYMLDDRLL